VHQEELTRQVIRAAQRKSRKLGRPLTRDDVVKLRVQTVEPWKRIVLVALGLGMGGLAAFCFMHEEGRWFGALFGIGSLIMVWCGIRGSKKEVESLLKSFADSAADNAASRLLEGLLDGL
jgi:hypothetical protein